MAIEANYGSSTVLETLRAARTARLPAQGKCR
jgi:hypothetical protein